MILHRPRGLAALAAILAACQSTPGTATLTIAVDAPGQVVSPLLFGDQVESFEPEGFWDETAQAPHAGALDLVRRSGLTHLRYPGGTPSDFFHWEETIGPIGGRKPQVNPFELVEGSLALKAVPFGPDEVARVSEELGVGVLVTVNAGTGTAEEAARWLAAWKRQGVRSVAWEVGNEIYLDDDSLGASIPRKTPEEYAAIFDRYARALRAEDPAARIGIIGCHNGGTSASCRPVDWNARVFSRITEQVDFVAVHSAYAPVHIGAFATGDDAPLARALLAAPEVIADTLDAHLADRALFANEESRHAELAVTEHSPLFLATPAFPLPLPDPTAVKVYERNRSLAAALYSAAMFHAFLTHGVTIANHLKLVSPWVQGLVSISSDQPPTSFVESAYFHVFRLYAQAAGGRVVPVQLTTDTTFDSDAYGFMPSRTGVPALHALAVVPAAGPERLWLYVVNRDLERAVVGSWRAPDGATAVEADVLDGPSYFAVNTPSNPQLVTVHTQPAPSTTRFEFAPHSLTRLRFR